MVKSYGTLCKFFNLSGLQFLHLQNEGNNNTHVTVLWQFIHSLSKHFLGTHSVCQLCSMNVETGVKKRDKNLCPVVLKF